MIKVYNRFIFTAVLIVSLAKPAFAQTFNDGPVQLQVRFADFRVNYNETDAAVLGVGFAPDEPVVKLWARDNADLDGQNWLGGTCHTFSSSLPATIPNINETLLNFTYPTQVPQYYDLRIDAFEDDNGSGNDNILGLSCSGGTFCGFDNPSCCGFSTPLGCAGLNEGDDKHCVMDPWLTQRPYRNGPPCQWFNQGLLGGSTCNGDYEVRIETFWRYTNGTSCATALDLGTITAGGLPLQHFNSNECYGNTNTASPGNDVWYKFHANGPIGITASLCGVNGAAFDSYLYLYSSCGAVTPDTANDNGCGNQSILAYSICQAGDYYLVVDGKTAGDFGTFTLSVQDNPNFVFAATPVVTNVSCFGATDGRIAVNVQGGTPPFTYAWSAAGVGNNDTATGLGGGTYTVTVTDGKGCQVTASATITVPAQISASAASTPASCGACTGSATATAQGGTTPYSYAWNSMPPQQLANAVLLCAGNYTVTVTDDAGCTVTASTTVQTSTTIVITVDSLKNVQCNGAGNGGIFISATGGSTPYTYNWSNQVNTEDNPNLGPGAYSLTITDQGGCTTTATYVISEPSILAGTVSFTFDPRCNGGSDGIVNITVNGGVQPYTYQWSPTGAVTQNLNNVTAGTHSVTVTDASGCTTTASATLNQPTPFDVTLTTGTLQCYGDSNGTASVTISGGNPPYTYFWSNFATTSSVNGLHAGPFSVVIEDARNCDTIATGTITSPAPIELELTPNAPLCSTGGNGSITVAINGGTSPFTYNWTGTGGFTSTAASPQVSTGSYQVTVTDANGCTGSGNTAVTSPAELDIRVVVVNPTCIGDSSGVVFVETPAGGLGGTPPYTYAWNGGQSDTSYLAGVGPGTYTVVVTDANGCTATAQGVVTDPETNGPNCGGSNIVLVPTAFSPNGDNVNDKLVAIMSNVQKLSMRVYNRWGEEVYYNPNMQANDGWDGYLRGKAQPIGTYVWYCDVTYSDGIHANERGSVTLVR